MKNILLISVITMLVNQLFSQDSLYLVATITGEQIGDQFGNVAGLGDVNGDECDDFIVGSVEYAKIYFGGVPFDTIADFYFKGNDTLSISAGTGAGDVNNDGFDDVLLGGFYNNGGFPKSIVFLYYGGANMDTIPDFQFIPPYGIQDMLGQISGAGDVNNDGYDDFIVGVPYNWYDGIGRAYLFLGGDTLADVPFLTFASDSLEDFFSRAVTGIGDVNDDNFDDIMIGVPNDLTGDTSSIYIYMGSSYMDNVPDYIFTGSEVYPIGSIISKAGDVNGDNLSDILFCYPTKLYYGDYNLNFSKSKLFCSEEENDNFGSSLSNSGDINNDGYSDILIGALNHRNNNNIMVGKTYCYLGGINMDTIADFSMEGETKWGQFSQYLCIGGDINNDGYDEVMVGAPNFPDHTNPLGEPG
jgi:hypothetical protein